MGPVKPAGRLNAERRQEAQVDQEPEEERGPEAALGRIQASPCMPSEGGEGPGLAQRALLPSLAPGAWPRSSQVFLGLKPRVFPGGTEGGRPGEHAFQDGAFASHQLQAACGGAATSSAPVPCFAVKPRRSTARGVFGQSGASPSTSLQWARWSGCCPFSKGNGASTLPATAGCSAFLPDS